MIKLKKIATFDPNSNRMKVIADVEKAIKYRGENFGMAYKTVGKISKEEVTLDTTCKMNRP